MDISWIPQAALMALGAIIWHLQVKAAKNAESNFDIINKALNTLNEYSRNELRAMDVRISVIEFELRIKKQQ